MKQKLARLWDKLINAPLVSSLARLQPPVATGPDAARAGRCWVAIKLVGLGDAVLMLPAMAAIEATGARLTIITTARCGRAFELAGLGAKIITLGGGSGQGLRAAWAALRAADSVLDFEQHVYWSALLTAVSRRSAQRVGFRTRGRADALYSALVDPGPEPRPMRECFDDIARAAGVTPVPGVRPIRVDSDVTERIAVWRHDRGLQRGQYTVIAPGSGATVRFRRLSAAQWVAILDDLGPGPVVASGTAIDAALIAQIQARAHRPVLSAMGLALAEVAALFADARLVLAIDSGPMHLAAAVGAPVVGIFGPDTPRRYGTVGPRAVNVSLNLSCSPCNNCFTYREARCINPLRYECMQALDATTVLEAARQLKPAMEHLIR